MTSPYNAYLVLNPRTKFEWMEKQWGLSECVQAEIWLEEAVRIFQSGCIANLKLETDAAILSFCSFGTDAERFRTPSYWGQYSDSG